MNKNKKIEKKFRRPLFSLFFLMCSAALLFYLRSCNAGKDQTAPVLYIEGENPVYTEGENTDILLEGIRAEDDVDGDVTDSVRVRGIYYSEDRTEAIVTYVARDKSNNLGSARRKVGVNRAKEEQAIEEQVAEKQAAEEQAAAE